MAHTRRLIVAGLLALAVFGTIPLAVAPARGNDPVETTAGQMGRFVGEVALEPEHGPPGTVVTVRGQDFPAGVKVDIHWNTVNGSWVLAGSARELFRGRRFDPIARVVGTAVTDSRGAFVSSFKVPYDFGFAHDITVVREGARLNQAGFQLDPHVTVSPQSGPVGTPITVVMHGIGYQYLFNVWQLVYDNKFTGWLSSVTTQGTAVAVIPATGPPGKHLVQIMAGIPNFPYLNTQQSPTPDRPTFTGVFTVTAGPPVLPPAPEQQGFRSAAGRAPDGDGPAIWVHPRVARVGMGVAVRSRRFAPGQEVNLLWFRVVGNRMTGRGWQEDSIVLGKARAATDGTLPLTFTVPDDLGGPHRIAAIVAGEVVAETELVITPSALPVVPASGPVGTIFTIHLKGGGWTETANIYTVVYDNAYLGYACSFNSQGDITIHLPASGEPGWHFVELYPAIYKGEDIRGAENFRVPQLSIADHPGERLPAFRFAFRVTK